MDVLVALMSGNKSSLWRIRALLFSGKINKTPKASLGKKFEMRFKAFLRLALV